jgi:tetratricopeptide (TPR) repeat protein
MDGEELEQHIRAGSVLPILEAYARSASVRHRRWLSDGLGRALDRADPGSVPEATLRALSDLGLSRESLEGVREAPPDHAVHVPLVAEGAHPSFCRLMHVTYDPPGSLGLEDVLDADARLAVSDALRAASERLGWRPEEHHRFGPVRVRGLEGMRIHGGSLGASAFVSAYALWTRREVRRGTAITGGVVNGRLAPVGAMAPKLRALAGRADIARLVVPEPDAEHARALARQGALDCEIVGVESLDALLEHCLSERPRARRAIEAEIAEAREEWDRAWQRFRWAAVRERLSRLTCDVPTRRPDLCVRVQTMLGASYRQLGEPEAALEILGQALAVLTTEEAERAVGDYERTFLHRHLALAYKDLCRFEEAEEVAMEAVAIARRGRLALPAASGLGTAGLIALARGDVTSALERLHEALRDTSTFEPGRAPRSHSYLVLAYGRAGRLDDARAQYQRARALLARLGDDDRTRSDEQWLRTYMAEAATLARAPDEVIEVLRAPCVEEAIARLPMPGLLARRWLGLAEIARGELDRGFARLASAPAAHPSSGAARVRFLAELAVLYEAEARVGRGRLDEDARGRARLALDRLPASRADGAFLGPAIARARALLDDRAAAPRALEAALHALLERCRALE